MAFIKALALLDVILIIIGLSEAFPVDDVDDIKDAFTSSRASLPYDPTKYTLAGKGNQKPRVELRVIDKQPRVELRVIDEKPRLDLRVIDGQTGQPGETAGQTGHSGSDAVDDLGLQTKLRLMLQKTSEHPLALGQDAPSPPELIGGQRDMPTLNQPNVRAMRPRREGIAYQESVSGDTHSQSSRINPWSSTKKDKTWGWESPEDRLPARGLLAADSDTLSPPVAEPNEIDMIKYVRNHGSEMSRLRRNMELESPPGMAELVLI